MEEEYKLMDKSKTTSDSTSLEEQSGQMETNLQQHRNLTNLEAMMIILKTTVGIGVVTLPLAFMRAGLWVGFFGIFVVGAVQTHCMLLVVGTSRYLCESLLVNVSQVTAQVGSCSVNLLLIGESCQQIFGYFFNIDLNLQFWLLLSFITMLIFVFARTLKHLAWFSLVANVGVFVSLVIILQHIVQDLPPASDYPIFNSWRTFPLYLGTVCFSFDSVCVVLPTQHKVKHPQDYAGLTGVLSTAMNISIIFYAAVGFYGYLKYGDAVDASITLSLPMGWLYLTVRALFVYSVYVTSGLLLYVVLGICWPPLEQRLTNETMKNKGEYLFRLVMISGLYVVAATVPHLDLMVSLTGSMGLTICNFIIPASLDLVIRWSDDKSRLHWRLVKDTLIIIIGLLVFVIGTGVALIKIIQAY